MKRKFFILSGVATIVVAAVFNVNISLRGESHSDLTLDKIQVLAINESSNWCKGCGEYISLCRCICAGCGTWLNNCVCQGADITCDSTCNGTNGTCYRWISSERKCKPGYTIYDACSC